MFRSELSRLVPNLNRRDFIHGVGALGAYGLVETQLLVQALTHEHHISRLAAQPPSTEGTWTAEHVEGQIPRDLNGALYRMSKGQLSNHGVPLRHWFLRIHRSAIVNLNFVEYVSGWFGGRLYVRLRDTKRTELTVSRTNVQQLRQALGL